MNVMSSTNAGDTLKAGAFAPIFAKLKPTPTDSLEEERRHRKQRLAGALRLFAMLGLSEGVSGHITARDPIDPDTFWVNPFGLGFDRIRVSDLLQVNSEGGVVSGDGVLNVSAFAIHAEIHRLRPDVTAAAHVHSMYGKAWSSLGRLLDPITQDACAFFEDHIFFDDTRVVITETSEGGDLAVALGEKRAAILRNHGLLTVGESVDEAAWWFVAMERCCQAQFLAESVGKPLLIDPQNARATHAVSGAPFAGWLNFQTLWHRVVSQQPELLT